MSAPGPSPLRILFAGELRYLLRDRMALVLLLVTPVVVYPVLFWGLGAMQEENERKAETKVVQVAAPAEWAGWLVEEDHIERVEPGSEAAEDDATVEVPPAPRVAARRACRRSPRHRRLPVGPSRHGPPGTASRPSSIGSVRRTRRRPAAP